MVVVGILCALGAAVAVAGSSVLADPCDDFTFSKRDWRAALAAAGREEEQAEGERVTTRAEKLARQVVDCGVVEVGDTRSTVLRRLGPPTHRESRDEWHWDVGWVNDAFGVGDGGSLGMGFRAGRVEHLGAP